MCMKRRIREAEEPISEKRNAESDRGGKLFCHFFYWSASFLIFCNDSAGFRTLGTLCALRCTESLMMSD